MHAAPDLSELILALWGKRRERLVVRGDLGPTLAAVLEMQGDRVSLFRVGDRIDRVDREQVTDLVVLQSDAHRSPITPATVAVRSFAKPDRIRLLTVPSGSSSMTATSR